MTNLLLDPMFLILLSVLLTCVAAYIDLYLALSELQRIDQQTVVVEFVKTQDWPI